MFNSFFSENRAIYDNVKNIVEPDRPQMTIQCCMDNIDLHKTQIPLQKPTSGIYIADRGNVCR